jgi:DNA polymerase-3 subunit chi
MPQIDFYILSSQSENSKQLFACRITEKAYKMQHSIVIQSENNKDAKYLDELLWNFRDDSFVPHHTSNDKTNSAVQSIVVPDNKKQTNKDDILINLSGLISDDHQKYQRIIEIVINENNDKQNARKRFAAYRELGYEIKSHNI